MSNKIEKAFAYARGEVSGLKVISAVEVDSGYSRAYPFDSITEFRGKNGQLDDQTMIVLTV